MSQSPNDIYICARSEKNTKYGKRWSGVGHLLWNEWTVKFMAVAFLLVENGLYMFEVFWKFIQMGGDFVSVGQRGLAEGYGFCMIGEWIPHSGRSGGNPSLERQCHHLHVSMDHTHPIPSS